MTDKFNKIAEVERAISKKYGKKAIMNPKSTWNTDKEEKFQSSVKKFYRKVSKVKDQRRNNPRRLAGILSCPVCEKFFLSTRDEVKVYKYGCCHECYVDFVEDREERWLSGWRPDKESIFKKR